MPQANWTQEETYLVAERAWSLAQQGRYREAAILLSGLLALKPDDRYARASLAALLVRLGHPEEALRQLEPGLRAHPDDVDCRVCRIDALIALGRREEARRELAWLPGGAAEPVRRRLMLRLEAQAG